MTRRLTRKTRNNPARLQVSPNHNPASAGLFFCLNETTYPMSDIIMPMEASQS
jgi:hypothetical protein